MLSRKNFLMVICILVLGFCIVTSATAQRVDIAMGSSQEGSSSYALSAAVSSIAQKYSDKINVLPKPFGGTLDGLRALERDRIETVLVMYDILGSVVYSTGSFSPPNIYKRIDDVRLHGVIGVAPYMFLVRQELAEDIKSLQDIEGYNVWLGAPMTGPRDLGVAVLKALGLYDKVKETSFDYKTLSDGIKTGAVDVLMTYGSSSKAFPSYFTEIEARNDLEIIPFSENDLEKITKEIPVLGRYEWNIPTEQLVHDIGFKKLLTYANYIGYITMTGLLSEEEVYEWDRLVYEYSDELAKGGATIVAGLSEMSNEEQILAFKIANNMGVPVHPGTAKYFKEFRGVDLESEGVVIKD